MQLPPASQSVADGSIHFLPVTTTNSISENAAVEQIEAMMAMITENNLTDRTIVPFIDECKRTFVLPTPL